MHFNTEFEITYTETGNAAAPEKGEIISDENSSAAQNLLGFHFL